MTPSAFVASFPLRHSTWHVPRVFDVSSVCTHRNICFPRATATPPSKQDAVSTELGKKDSSKPDPVPISPLSPSAIPYFAYFAHMNPRKFGPLSTDPLRRFPVLQTDRAVLPSYKLTFNAAGLPPEPAFANITPDSSSAVHGVIHWLSRSDFDRLLRAELVAQSGFPDIAKAILPKVISVSVTDESSGALVQASTIVYPPNAPFWAKPSRRYLEIGLDGAYHWQLDNTYIISTLSNVSTANGLLGAFGLLTEPRPHPLDRPNPSDSFGNLKTEFYSPYVPIRARYAVDAFERSESAAFSSAIRLVQLTPDRDTEGKRPLYFLPGIDGNGKNILNQVPGLEKDGVYSVKSFVYPPDNRQPLKSLISEIIDTICRDADGRPVSIVGESMGGAMSFMVAIENARRMASGESFPKMKLDLLLTINPSTSFYRSDLRSAWELMLNAGLPDALYRNFLPFVLLPFLIDWSTVQQSVHPETFPRLRRMLFSLHRIADVLPQDALAHRIKLLGQMNPSASDLDVLTGTHGPKHIGVICAINDNLLPSFSEMHRLRRDIKDIHYAVVPYGGHVLMFDKRFSLTEYLRAFNREKSVGSQSIPERAVPCDDVQRRRAAIRRKLKDRDKVTLRFDKRRENVRRLRDAIAPILPESATVFIGEENIPLYDPKTPVLFVSNHTLLGLSDGVLVQARILETRGVLLRGLVHPQLMRAGFSIPGTGAKRITRDDLDEFGARTTSPRVLLELLAMGRWSILFPGGAREALKESEAEKYAVVWPEKPEFVRACALFGAVVVPVSTVGAEDRVRILGGTSASKRIIKAMGRVTGREVKLARDDARQWKGEGIGEVKDDEVTIVPPLIWPSGRDRLYFRFGKPFFVDEDCLYDDGKEREIYEKIRDAVKEGVDILKRRREHDYYRSVERRRDFTDQFGDGVAPPAGPAWAWAVSDNSCLDEDLQPLV